MNWILLFFALNMTEGFQMRILADFETQAQCETKRAHIIQELRISPEVLACVNAGIPSASPK